MGRIIATEFVSLDGVVEAPGGGEDFEYGGVVGQLVAPFWCSTSMPKKMVSWARARS